MIIYDYAITLPEEIITLWKRKKSLASIAILVNRYALLAQAATLIILLMPVTGNPLMDPVCGYGYSSSVQIG